MRTLSTLLFAGLFLLSLISCKPKVKEPLSEAQFIEVFTAIHLAEGHLRSNGLYGDSARRMASFVYKAVFNEKGVDSADFFKTYALYAAEPTRLAAVLEQVQIRLNEEEQ